MNDLRKQIDNLEMIINVQEENYKTALQSKVDLSTVRIIRESIKKLKGDLQILLDQDSVKKTGELPDDDSSKD